MGLVEVIKHLPGRHNQLRHGRRKNKIPLNAETIREVLAKQYKQFSPSQIMTAMDNFRSLIKDAPVCMRVPPEALSGILRSKRFKNQHETGTSGGINDPKYRAEAERIAFGNDLEKPTDFPVYGYIGTGPNGLVPDLWYGPIKIVFNEDIKQRTTVTYNDSLDNFSEHRAVGTPVLHPSQVALDSKIDSLARRDYYAPYVEAQIHNGVTIKDIKHVYVPAHHAYDSPGGTPTKVIRELEAAGIPYTVVDTKVHTMERFQ